MESHIHVVPKIPITVDIDSLDSGVAEILKIIRPEWNTEKLNKKIHTEGLMNKLISLSFIDEPTDVVIVKIYGSKTGEMIDRKAEIETMNFLHSQHMGPALYGIFENGITYEFLHGAILKPESCRRLEIYPRVAAEMARLHSIPLQLCETIGSTKKSMIWDKIDKYNELGDDVLKNNPEVRAKYAAIGIEIGWGAKLKLELQEIVEKAQMPLVLCHNDLLPANIIYNKERNSISFIDYEYCGTNYAPFDVANHFLEFAGVVNTDFSKIPDEAFISAWLGEYLKHWEGPRPWSQTTFESWVRLCFPLSHFFWITWNIVQTQNSSIEFDFMEYGSLRVLDFNKWMGIIREEYSEL